MSTYKGKPVIVGKSADELFERFSDLTIFQNRLNELPEAERQKFAGVKFTPDSITIPNPQIGEMTLEVVERVRPEKVVFGAPGTPINLAMNIKFKPLGDTETEVQAEIEVDLPLMIRPFIGPKMQEAADKFGEMIINFAK